MIDLFNGDCLEQMQKMDSDSVDLVCTDPPYGYSFMNKDWDKAVPRVEIWRECLRVLKAGAFAFVMSAPRSDVQAEMILKLKEAGFEVGFSPIYWAYASGFPKASNISKMVDKRLGFERKGIKITNGAGSYLHTELVNDGRSKEAIKHSLNSQEYETGNAISNEAIELDGFFGGFQPKPAVEVVLVAMKPLSEKTFVEQALANGHGGTWLGKCRIPYANEKDTYENGIRQEENIFNPEKGWNDNNMKREFNCNVDGRFPANLLVSDSVLDNGEITESKVRVDNQLKVNMKIGMFEGGWKERGNNRGFDDVGGFSRYFSLDAWWEQQIKTMPKNMREPIEKTFPFIIEPKASKGEKNEGLEEFDESQVSGGGGGIGNYLEDVNSASGKFGSEKAPAKNIHPTCKPVSLMSYLVVLGCKKGEVVLDPFVGSGTTCIASQLMNRKSIGIELNKEYFEIAKARIKSYKEQTKLF